MVFQKIIFTKEECDIIINEPKTNYQNWGHLKVRDYTSESIIYNEDSKWIFDRLINFFLEATNKELLKINPTIHFHTYKTNNRFEKHNDGIYGRMYVIGVLLNEMFDGGELYVYENSEIIINKFIGNAYCFESRTFHEVKQITHGIRHSLIYFINQEDIMHKINKLL